MKKITILVQLLLSFIIPGCGQTAFDKQLNILYKKTVPLIQPAQLATELKNNQNIILLDTRSPAEFAVSHLPAAQFVNYDEFSLAQVKHLAFDTPIVVYCSVGVRSEKIGEKLLRAGYKNVRNLYGGIFEWKNKGMIVVKPDNTPTDSVHTYNHYWAIWLKKGIKVYE
ncbi:rhodanese-like domain-containing protein [Adhaeribacter radiodurans]|uniref:Rhodanese-like domain-containing protein n=1 Tax=Adhaeribacter radiodurans TaxID=2745197 RepID=A0A7L7L8F8_9BACT|nr:rhodanese-like domain-containing protein [Adhaeribacter radiodurans]QMU28689.1 rhodanese-like domain-containing protein [Adhaeribacter radiodurans]